MFENLDALEFGNDLAILPVPVPHSGADNVAFVASHKGERGAVITDLGSWTEEDRKSCCWLPAYFSGSKLRR